MDPVHVSDQAVVEKYQESKLKEATGLSDSDDNLLEILEELDNDDEILNSIKEQRLEQLKKEFRSIDRAADTYGEELGRIRYLSDEKEVMTLVTSVDVAVVHFFQPTFPKCKAMNSKLELLAEKHVALCVAAIQADQAPFLVTKLKVKVLPFVVVYKKGQEVARIVGFEGIGAGSSEVDFELLERKLLDCGAISRRTTNYTSIRNKAPRKEDSDSDWD